MARAAARRLGLANVRYEVGDVMDYLRGGERFDAAYMLDIVHHIPEEAVRPLLEQVAKTLPAGGRLLVKDVDRQPAYKRWFTHALDRVMDPRTPVRYWGAEELQALLEDVGFEVHRHLMVDVLPYPHVLYIGRAPAVTTAASPILLHAERAHRRLRQAGHPPRRHARRARRARW